MSSDAIALHFAPKSTSKKGVAGIGVPKHFAAKAAALAAFLCPDTVQWWPWRGPQGRRFRSAECPVRQPVRAAAPIGVVVAVVELHSTEATMAGSSLRTSAQLSLHLPTPGDADPAAPDLHIRVWHDDVVSFEGSRAQLEAEPDLIAPGIEWPKARDLTRWERGGMAFTLMRCPPADQKRLPFKTWSQLDSWRVNCRPTSQSADWPTRAMQRKLREFHEASRRASPEGRAEAWAMCERASAAARDEKFRRFKTQLLAAARKPSRKAARTQEGGAA
jgi:hypothetical protein